MNLKSTLITGVAVTVLFILLEFVVHGYMLKDMYMQTASIWRPEADMQSLVHLMLIGEVIFTSFFTIIFALGYDARKQGLAQGVRFGLLMACLIAPFSALSWYVILPIPATLAQYWFLADFSIMTLLGTAAGLIYNPRS